MGEIAAICGEPLESFEPTFAVLMHLRGGIAMWPDGDLSEGRKSFITVSCDCHREMGTICMNWYCSVA